MDIRIPPYPGGARPTTLAVLKGILEYDQFDDWLPDPLFYEDQRLNERRAVQRIERLWQLRQLTVPAREVLNLPRASGQTVPVIALPLDARVCAHGVIAAMASRINSALLRDKVYGFEFRKEKNPLFSQPGEGLKDLFENTLEAADISNGNMQILDVDAFSRRASIGRLETTLQRAGARPDETSFVRQLLQAGPQSLPSIDDAFAFLYNFYLQPVDQSLASAKTNFFRYRDEYYTLDDKARQIVETQLVQLGLSARLIADYKFSAPKEKLSEQVTPEHSEAEKLLGPVEGGKLVAKYTCDTWNDQRRCTTDTYEIVYEAEDLSALPRLFALQYGSHPLDGIRILPILRAINQHRKSGVLLRPSFDRATDVFNSYRKKLGRGRAWLRGALATAVARNSDWQITWITPLLSDLGPLQDNEVTLLQQVIAKPAIGQAAKSQAQLALARSSLLPADQFWVNPSNALSRYQFRSALLGARYLANRGNSSPWQRLEQAALSTEPELRDYLLTNITGANG